MNKTILKILEYNKITEMLAAQCGSSLAKNLAVKLTPAGSLSEAKEKLEATAEALRVLAVVNPPLGGIHDLRPAVKRAKLGATIELEDFVAIRETLDATKQIKYFFRELDPLTDCDNLRGKAHGLEILGNLTRRLYDTIDEHGSLRDDASSDLLRIRRGITANEQRIKEVLQAILHNPDNQKVFRETIVSMRGDRYVLPVRAEYRRSIPGIVHDQSSTGSTLFIEPMAVVERNNEIKELTLAERREVERILSSLSREVAKESDAIFENLKTLAFIDFSFGCGKLAREMGASQPELNDSGLTDIKQARHPLIDRAIAVPIDIRLGDDYRLLLVTGPNTGGKTVGMKTLGLLSIMAQSGLFIPAERGSRLSVYREVYADIGDEQSIEQSLSTFSAHMKHIVFILKKATHEDLVLLDELGAGTDPAEGAALATAVLEELLARGASILATTHYSELKTFAYKTAGVENACVEFDVKTLRPTYRLLIGIPGASNAFAISRRLGLDKEIVERAGSFIKGEHARFEEVVSELESKRRFYEKKNDELRSREKQLREQEEKIKKLEAELSEKRADLIRKAKEESAAIVRKARRESIEIIKDLKEQYNDQGIKKRQQAIEEARQRLREASADMPGIEARPSAAYKEEVDVDKIVIGAIVYVPLLGQKATVVKVKGDELTVEIGSMRTKVSAGSCNFVSGPREEKGGGSAKHAGIYFSKVKSARTELDLRGYLVDDAIPEVNKFIDDAQLAGLKQINIIHGKGTGQLRQGIHRYLAEHKAVSEYAFAREDEGGSGATIVTLK